MPLLQVGILLLSQERQIKDVKMKKGRCSALTLLSLKQFTNMSVGALQLFLYSICAIKKAGITASSNS